MCVPETNDLLLSSYRLLLLSLLLFSSPLFPPINTELKAPFTENLNPSFPLKSFTFSPRFFFWGIVIDFHPLCKEENTDNIGHPGRRTHTHAASSKSITEGFFRKNFRKVTFGNSQKWLFIIRGRQNMPEKRDIFRKYFYDDNKKRFWTFFCTYHHFSKCQHKNWALPSSSL